MSGRRSSLFVLLIAPYAAWVMAGEPDAGLRNDPFARPNLALAPASAAQASEVAAKEWKPQLRAVILAGRSSMVNVEGTIVSLGGQIDGFRLTGVEDRKAVFTKDDARVELTMGGDRAGDK
jgi:hypothetical protein